MEEARTADIHTPLLHNHWYVAGYAKDFDSGLHERTFLNRSILIFRKEDGELAALQNRCAHRSFPLSEGWREGDSVRCRYHGALYNALGEMTEFPSMPKCPRITVRSYPIVVQGPLAWIWMGEAGADKRPAPPATPWFEENAGWTYATGQYELNANWLLMADNLMDLTHIPFLHQTTFKFPKAFAAAPIKLEMLGDRLCYYRDNPPGYQRSGFLPVEASEAIEQAGFQARSEVNFVSPAFISGGGRFSLENPAPGAQLRYEWEVIHFMTPITQNRTRYFYFFARNYALDNADLSAKIQKTVEDGFEEDRVAIQFVQTMFEQDKHAYREMNFNSDRASVAMRRIVASMAQRETQASANVSAKQEAAE